MAAQYCFSAQCTSVNAPKLASFIALLKITKQACNVPNWYHRQTGAYFESSGEIEKELCRISTASRPSDRTLMVEGKEGDDEITVQITTPTPGLHDNYFWTISFFFWPQLPDVNFFLQLIELLHPDQAEVWEYGVRERFHFTSRHLYLRNSHSNPLFIDWIQYWSRDLVQMLGGMNHVLATPAFRAERFMSGVLIQLTEDWFNIADSTHIEIQRRAMIHLGINPDWQPPL